MLKSRVKRIVLALVISAAFSCTLFCGTAFAASAEFTNISDGQTFYGAKVQNVTIKTHYAASRQTYCEFSVYNNSGTLLSCDTVAYSSIGTSCDFVFVPKEGYGTYKLKTECIYYINSIRQSGGTAQEITVYVVDPSAFSKLTPKITSIVSNGSGKVTIQAQNLGGTGFIIYRYNSKTKKYAKLGVTTSTTYVDKTAGQATYYYKILSYVKYDGKNYYSKYSASKSVNCKITAHKSQFKPYEGQNRTAFISFNYSSTYTKPYGFAIYRATSKSGTYKLIAHTTKMEYEDSTVSAGRYWYKVRPYYVSNKKRVYGTTTSASSVSTALPATPSATTLTVTKASSTSAKLTWKAVSSKGNIWYDVYRAEAKNGDYTRLASIYMDYSTSYTDTGLTKGKTYYYKIVVCSCGYNSSGEWVEPSTSSAIKYVKL